MELMDLYNKLPVFMQNAACSVEGYRINTKRYNKFFFDTLQQYSERSKWSYSQLCEYRDRKTKEMLKHCYKTVPYYKRLFSECGFNYETYNYIDQLSQLPILDKQTVIDNYDQFISEAISRDKMVMTHTSGTTGSGFKFLTTNEALCEQWAVWWRYRNNLGINFNTWCYMFGGRSIVPIEQKKSPYSRFNIPAKQEYFSAYHINDETMKWYVDEIVRRRYIWIHGYPSVINLLADYIIENEDKISTKIKHITTGAENLMPMQKQKIEKAFGVEPRTHYGMSEGVANFSENKNGIMYVDEDYAVTEFVPLSEGNNFEIVGTSLSNYAMPLIRYRTKDIANFKEEEKGRQVLSLDGRQEDYIVLPSGSKLGRLDHIFKDMINVREAQIYQKEKTSIEVRVVKNERYSVKDEENLLKEIKSRMNEIEVRIVYVDSIKKTASGKLRFVISELE